MALTPFPADCIKGKTRAEYVSEIKQQTPRQSLQAQDPQQLGNTGFSLKELSASDVHIEAAAQAWIMQGHGRALPIDLSF
jgi:hypothetical protein